MTLKLLDAEPEIESTLPDLFEVKNGQIVEVPPMSFYANEVANDLRSVLEQYLQSNKLGRARVEQVYEIPLPDDHSRIMRPDVSYISFERFPKNRPIPVEGLGFDVVPEWVIEVTSPNDKAEDVMEKIRDYLDGGVSVVWQVYPVLRALQIFDRSISSRFCTDTAEITSPFLPGFSLKLADILPEVERPDRD